MFNNYRRFSPSDVSLAKLASPITIFIYYLLRYCKELTESPLEALRQQPRERVLKRREGGGGPCGNTNPICQPKFCSYPSFLLPVHQIPAFSTGPSHLNERESLWERGNGFPHCALSCITRETPGYKRGKFQFIFLDGNSISVSCLFSSLISYYYIIIVVHIGL